jgi:hypothetical protein
MKAGGKESPCPNQVASLVIALGAVALLTAACGSSPPKLTGTVSAPAPSITAVPVLSQPALACQAQATRPHPRDDSIVGVRVSTVAHAMVTAIDAGSALNGQNPSGRADAAGQRTLWFRVGSASPGVQVMIDVHIARRGRKGSCQASFMPRAALAAAQPPPAAPSSPPHPAPPPTTAAPPPPGPGCHPLTDSGKCYEPGEFCRDSDHGVTGVAGDGETIRCEDNDGWRWEPV